jgi:hypothetical protein
MKLSLPAPRERDRHVCVNDSAFTTDNDNATADLRPPWCVYTPSFFIAAFHCNMQLYMLEMGTDRLSSHPRLSPSFLTSAA